MKSMLLITISFWGALILLMLTTHPQQAGVFGIGIWFGLFGAAFACTLVFMQRYIYTTNLQPFLIIILTGLVLLTVALSSLNLFSLAEVVLLLLILTLGFMAWRYHNNDS